MAKQRRFGKGDRAQTGHRTIPGRDGVMIRKASLLIADCFRAAVSTVLPRVRSIFRWVSNIFVRVATGMIALVKYFR